MIQAPHWPKIPIWKIPAKLSLDNMLKILEALGNPQEKLPPTIHIAGTNGKGSSVAMLRSIYETTGYKAHSYTSPHIISFNERINLAGEPISDDHLYEILERVRIACEKQNIEATFFEGTTAAAFLAFAESKADIVLLETGLGGRLDCTNVMKKPALTLITSISYDHMEYLGEDLLQITSEKAGIIKPAVPCVIGAQSDDSVYQLLMDTCEKLDSPSFCFEYDYGAEKLGTGFRYKSQKYTLDLPSPALAGDHQVLNASGVVASVMLLNNIFQVSGKQIAEGLKNVSWPGRIQKVIQNTKNIDIYLDGAHNEAGAIALSSWARNNLKGDIYLIMGMTRNRDVGKFCQHFKDIVKGGCGLAVQSEPSSYSASVINQKARDAGIDLEEADSIKDAISKITEQAKDNPATIIVTGSLFLVSDFLKGA